MKCITSDRGFQLLVHDTYGDQPEETRLAGASSAIGDYDDSFDRPGSSYLWIGEHHHLDRVEVAYLVNFLQQWLDTGKLFGTGASLQ